MISILEVNQAVNIYPKFASLTANGLPINITFQADKMKSVILKTSRQLIIDNNGFVSSKFPFDLKNCKAWVVALDTLTGLTDTCKVSIVPWVSNLSSLKITEVNTGYRIFGKFQDTLIVNYNNILYKTGSDLKDLIHLSPFPLLDTDYYWAFLKTPAGYFIRKQNNIYFSKDEKKWDLDYTTRGRGIRNSFAFTYDSITQTTRIFAHDYSVTGQDTFPHSVYRKIISPNQQNNQWEKVFTFFSQIQWAANKTLFPACRHIHTLVVDPYTGHIWIGTGDNNQHSHIYYSDDNGTTWKHIGMGSQEWRVVSIWFTKTHVYWAMDSQNQSQKVFRISRSVYKSKGYWPDMTSGKLTTGYPKQNVLYLITSLKDFKYYFDTGIQAFVGDIVWGNPQLALNVDNSLISVNDPALDYRELVASLPNSSLWGNATVIDDKGDQVLILSSDAEGHLIDNRPRVFGIKERPDETVDVQELLSTDAATSIYSQFYPYEQDAIGNIYFQTSMMNYSIFKWNGIIKTTLDWHDNSLSKGGNIEIVKDNIIKDTTFVNLKLLNYNGKIIKWQSANSNFIWSDIISPINNGTFNDTISCHREKNKIQLIRTIVQKDGDEPVASDYIKIDSLRTIVSNIDENKLKNQPFNCYPNPAKDILYIHSNTDSLYKPLIELFSIEGTLLLSQTINNPPVEDIQLPLYSILKGVYVLKISDKNSVFTYKVVKK